MLLLAVFLLGHWLIKFNKEHYNDDDDDDDDDHVQQKLGAIRMHPYLLACSQSYTRGACQMHAQIGNTDRNLETMQVASGHHLADTTRNATERVRIKI